MRRSRGNSDDTPELGTTTGQGADRPGLLVVAGEGTFTSRPLDGRELVIGRGEECDVRIDHKVLSRRHAVLRPGPPATIQDLGSRNGTRIGGKGRRGGEPVELRASDSFHIGPFSFVLVPGAATERRSLSAREAFRISDPTPDGIPALVREIAARPTSVVILGETGVGKEVLAETLHVLSERRGPLTRINCAALSESLLESELFGHEKGAFTGATAQKRGLLESAEGGTVFLDEVGELPLPIQAKLLRAIEQREVLRLGSTRPIAIDVRFVAATNRDLPAEVEAGRFRRDLFFRLDGVTLVVPPLRERTAMIGRLALGFLGAARRARGGEPRLRAEVLAALEGYAWPGNVRELRAVIERALLLARDGDIAVQHLSFAKARAAAPTARVDEPDAAEHGLDAAERAERSRIIAALDACAGNQTRAARQLGIARTTLAGKLIAYRIPRPRT
jgi:DNA-binding NtrC family response regulator